MSLWPKDLHIAESFYLLTVEIRVVYEEFEKCYQIGFAHFSTGVRSYQCNNWNISLEPVKKENGLAVDWSFKLEGKHVTSMRPPKLNF